MIPNNVQYFNMTPIIVQYFNPDLLMSPMDRNKKIVNSNIIPLSSKKIRNIDVGKKREFENLLKKYEIAYERKKDEENRYNEKIKKAAEMPRIPTSGKTMRFRRYEDKKLLE